VDLSWTTGEFTPNDSDQNGWGGADDICRIILTSGTTGKSRGFHSRITRSLSEMPVMSSPRATAFRNAHVYIANSASPHHLAFAI